MNIISRTLLAGFMACPFLGFAQQVPLFQFTLHFQDSIGNKDSIVLGYDPSASSQDINPQFGEALITSPFDSIFEVRVMHGDDSQAKTYKKVIEDMEGGTPFDTCITAFYSKIIINAKFPPVRITYDSTLFPVGICRNVILSPHWGIFTLPEWWHACEYYCMGSTSRYVEDLSPPSPQCWNYLHTEKEVEGQGLKMLPGLFFATFSGPGPCNDTTFLAAKDASTNGFGILNPNPVQEYFTIQVPPGSKVHTSVSDITGRPMLCPFTLSEDVLQFDAKGLSPGVYFILLQTEKDKRAVYKFVKV